jgi:hypothetical protein
MAKILGLKPKTSNGKMKKKKGRAKKWKLVFNMRDVLFLHWLVLLMKTCIKFE